MIKVYQIHLSKEELEQLRVEGWESKNPKIQAYGQRSLGRVENVKINFYSHVANIKTYDREDAFRLMNLWEEGDMDLIELIDDNAYSMSVGDIVEMENGDRYLCSSFGFREI